MSAGQVTACAGASGAVRRARQCAGQRGHQPGQNRRSTSRDSMTLGACDGETREGTRRDCAGETSRSSHATHSYARHLLMNGIPINYLSRWLGHTSIQTTLIYPKLVPDPT